WQTIAGTDRSHFADVLHRHRLPTSGIVRYGEHYEWNTLRPHALDELTERFSIHVSLKRVSDRRLIKFRDRKIDRFGPEVFDVCASRIKVCVVGDDASFLAHDGKQDALSSAALVRGNHLLKSKDVAHHCFKSIKTRAAGVRLVATHQGRPLSRTHRRGAAVGQQVDDHVFRFEQKQVVEGFIKISFALRPRRHFDWFDYFDSEWFNYCFHVWLNASPPMATLAVTRLIQIATERAREV